MEENKNITETQETEVQVVKTYTQEEVDALLQSEADKRVTAALKKAERKKQDAVKEAEKLAKMDADERYRYELEQREAAIVEKENQLALAENKAACTSILADKGIPVQLVDFVVDKDADVMNEKIKTLDKYFKLAVKNEVEKRLAGNAPKKNLPVDGQISKENIKKMSIKELNELYLNNPELYKNLVK